MELNVSRGGCTVVVVVIPHHLETPGYLGLVTESLRVTSVAEEYAPGAYLATKTVSTSVQRQHG